MQGSKLFIGNLAHSVEKKELEDLFSKHGEVVDVKIIEGRGFGFIQMSNQSEAEKARNELNGLYFKGKNLKIEEAKPSMSRNRQRRSTRRY